MRSRFWPLRDVPAAVWLVTVLVVAAVHPFAVDSASGTEAAPGRKDPAKLEAFFRAVEQADAAVPKAAV